MPSQKPLDPRVKQIQNLLFLTGKSIRWLAGEVGTTHTTVDNILTGLTRNPRDKTLLDKMVKVLEEQPVVRNASQIVRREMWTIPVGSGLMAGPPQMNDNDVTYEEFPAWNSEFNRWGRVVEGDSMSPVLRAGDIAVFEDRRFENGHVVHAFKDGEDCLKAYRAFTEEDKVLASFNPDGPTFSAQGWSCKGVCVGRIRTTKYSNRQVFEFPHGLTWAMKDDEDLA